MRPIWLVVCVLVGVVLATGLLRGALDPEAGVVHRSAPDPPLASSPAGPPDPKKAIAATPAAGVSVTTPRAFSGQSRAAAVRRARIEDVQTWIRERRDRDPRFRVRARRAPIRSTLASLESAGVLERSSTPVQVGEVQHTGFQLRKAGLPIFNRRGRIHERAGELVALTGETAFPPLAGARWVLSPDQATALAVRRAGVTALRANPRAEQGFYARPGGTEPVWRISIPASRPFGTWQVTVHADTGEVLDFGNLVRHVTGVGRVYHFNAVTTPAPSDVPLYDLAGEGLLAGLFTQVFDVREVEAFRPDEYFAFPVDDGRFVQTSAYRGLTDAARFAVAHGFPAFAEPVPAFTNLVDALTGGEYNNAFYDPFFPMFGFGNGNGVATANLGTDLDVAVHEMMHHLFQVLVDPMSSTSLPALSAINEGVADTLAAIISGDPNIAESVIPGQPYLRTIDSDRIYPDDFSLDPHIEGLIYAGLNWDLIATLGVDVFMDILVAGLPSLPPDAEDPAEYTAALVAGDLQTTMGRNRSIIESLASSRGLDFLEEAGFQGFLEQGIPQTGFLSNGDFHVYVFSEFPGSRALRFSLTGTGDADLQVHSSLDADNFVGSYGVSSNEFIALSRFTRPSVDDDDDWIVAVFDYPDDGFSSSYTLSVDADLPTDGISIGGSKTDEFAEGGEIDYVAFSGTANRIVRLEGTSLTPGLDIAVAIFDPVSFEVFGVDDDQGPGLDALIQGARLPYTGVYGIASISLTADVDPSVGAGSYRLDLSECANAGSDLDGDGLADVCDDDDDDDGFVDGLDVAPADAFRCQDWDADTCDDCTSGEFAPFTDGPDSDGDALCDAGDPDDDNDGCPDVEDRSPLSPSVDEDLDFVGLDCDNCPDDYNPDQLDEDRDGVGNACEVPEPGAGLQGLAALLAAAWIRRTRARRVTEPSARWAACGPA